MKVIAISGSPRKGGNTERAVELALAPIAEAGIKTEMISLAGKDIAPCIACGSCREAKRCTAHDDDFSPIYEKALAAEAIILASPVYFGCATSFTSPNDMIQVGSGYWNVVLAHQPGETDKDTEAVKTLARFGENVAWLLEKIHA